MKHYIYKGPIYAFETLKEYYYEAETWATSPTKARNNIAYRYKKEHNIASNCKLTLPGELRELV